MSLEAVGNFLYENPYFVFVGDKLGPRKVTVGENAREAIDETIAGVWSMFSTGDAPVKVAAALKARGVNNLIVGGGAIGVLLLLSPILHKGLKTLAMLWFLVFNVVPGGVLWQAEAIISWMNTDDES